MQEITQAILQLGVAPVIAGYLLYDYSKKLSAIEQELIKIHAILDEQTKLLEELCKQKRSKK